LIVLATEWGEYQNIDPRNFISLVRQPILVDARNALDRNFWLEAGWTVYALGRGDISALQVGLVDK
jgi:UDPglucose 6-dehydrogenase